MQKVCKFDEKMMKPVDKMEMKLQNGGVGNGLKVGINKEEALTLCPELLEVELSMDDMYWNGICYPACWIEQFEYALVVDLENGIDDLPVYLALFMKDEKVVAISPYYPTAG